MALQLWDSAKKQAPASSSGAGAGRIAAWTPDNGPVNPSQADLAARRKKKQQEDDAAKKAAAEKQKNKPNTDSNAQKLGHAFVHTVEAGGKVVRAVARPVVSAVSGQGGKAVHDTAQLGADVGLRPLGEKIASQAKYLGGPTRSERGLPAADQIISDQNKALERVKSGKLAPETKKMISKHGGTVEGGIKLNSLLANGADDKTIQQHIKADQKAEADNLKKAGGTLGTVVSLGVGGPEVKATKSLVEGGIKEGAKAAGKKVATGATAGGAYGASSTIAENPDATAKEIAKNTAIGAATGAAIPAAAAGLKTRPIQKVDAFLNDLGTKAASKVSETGVGKKVGNIKERVGVTFGDYLAPVMRDFKGLKDTDGRQVNENIRLLDTNVTNSDAIGTGRLRENKAFNDIAELVHPDKTTPGSLRAARRETKAIGEFISAKQRAINNRKIGKGSGEIPVGTAKQERAYKLLNQATKDDVKYAYDNNLITKAQHDKWIKDENYTRVQKEMDDHVQSQYKGTGGPNASISKPGALSQRLKGGTKGKSVDPFVAYVDWSKKITHDVQRAKLSNYIIDKRVEHGLGKGHLRTADTVEKRIQTYAEAKQLRVLRTGLEKAVKTESRYGKQLATELNQLNKKGKDLSIKNAGSSKQPLPKARMKAHIDSLIKTSTADLNRVKRKIAARDPKLAAHIDNIISLKHQHEIAAKEVKELVSIARANGDKTATGKATIKTLKRGIKEVYEDEPRIVDAINKVGRVELHAMLRYAQAPSKLVQRAAVAWNFAFTGKNVTRDQVSSAILSKNALATHNPVSFMVGLKEAALKPTAKSVIRAVGARKTAARVLNPTEEYVNFLKNVAGSTRTDISRDIKKPTRATYELLGLKNETAIRKLENVNSATENLTRYQNYYGTLKSDLKKGVDPETAHKNAIQAARENSVDFMRQGDAAPFLKIFQPFANANIQGSRSLLRAFKERPLGTSMKIATTILGPVAASTYYNLSDPERAKVYDALSPADKANNLIFITGNGSVFKVPLAPGVKELAAPVRQMIEAEHGYGDRPGFMATAKALVGTVNPSSGAGDLIPQFAKPVVEAKANYSFFKGDNIVPDYLKDKDPNEQVFKGTGQTYRDIGNKFGISPLAARNIIVGYTSAVGEQGISLFDQLRGRKNPKVVTENRNVAQQVKSAFYEPKPDLNKRAVNVFFDTYQPIKSKRDAVSKEVTSLVKAGKIGEATRKANDFNNTLPGSFNAYEDRYGSPSKYDPSYEDMVKGLPIKTSHRAFESRKKQ